MNPLTLFLLAFQFVFPWPGPGPAPSSVAAWQKGFDFRGTSGYVSDATNCPVAAACTYVLGGSDTYPISPRNGAVFGWQNGTVTGSDRWSAGPDTRIAGVNTTPNGVAALWFRVDLPAPGVYKIGIALGDASYPQASKMIVADDTTALFTISGGTGASGFIDANNINWAYPAWAASNTTRSATFSTSILRVYLGDPAGTGSSTLAHLWVSTQ